jgi:hypothetical protein
MNIQRPARIALGGLVLGVSIGGGAFAALALSDPGSDPEPVITTVEVPAVTEEPTASADPVETPAPVVDPAPAPVVDPAPVITPEPVVTLDPPKPTPVSDFSNFKPGDPLPQAPAYVAGEPVQTVPGPYGPIYPDGYSDGSHGDNTTPPVPPAVPGGLAGSR